MSGASLSETFHLYNTLGDDNLIQHISYNSKVQFTLIQRHDVNMMSFLLFSLLRYLVAMVGVYLVLVFTLLRPALWPGLSSDNCWLSQDRRGGYWSVVSVTWQQSHTDILERIIIDNHLQSENGLSLQSAICLWSNFDSLIYPGQGGWRWTSNSCYHIKMLNFVVCSMSPLGVINWKFLNSIYLVLTETLRTEVCIQEFLYYINI